MATRMRLIMSTVCLLLVTAWTGIADAGAPRLLALGGDGAYLEDTRGVLRWYGSLVDHADMVTLETGLFNIDGYYRRYGDLRMTGPALGAHVALGGERPAAVLGLWLAESGNDTEPGTLVEDRLATTGTLLAARDFGPFALGLGWRHGGADDSGSLPWDDPGVATAREVDRDDLGLGARVNLGDEAYLDLAGEWRRTDVRTLTPQQDGTSIDSGDLSSTTSLALRARAFIALNPTLVLVPVAEYLEEDRPAAPTNRSLLLDGWSWRLGCGFTWLPDPDNMVLFTADHRRAASDRSGTAPDESTPVRLESSVWSFRAAGEFRMNAFWSLRISLGLESFDESWSKTGDDDVNPGFNDDPLLLPTGIGLAVHAGPWDLDLSLANLPPARADGLRYDTSYDYWFNAGLTYSF